MNKICYECCDPSPSIDTNRVFFLGISLNALKCSLSPSINMSPGYVVFELKGAR